MRDSLGGPSPATFYSMDIGMVTYVHMYLEDYKYLITFLEKGSLQQRIVTRVALDSSPDPC